jgi:hypothetical protein
MRLAGDALQHEKKATVVEFLHLNRAALAQRKRANLDLVTS